MERYLKIDDVANKSKELRETLTLIQDAETRIKQAIFHSFITNGSVEALVFRIIEDTMKRLPESADKEKYAKDLKANANHWFMVVKYTNQALTVLKTKTAKIITPITQDGMIDEAAYKRASVMFEKGHTRQEDYQRTALRLTKELAKDMAGEAFKSSSVDFKGLTMKTNISLRASTERRIRDQIHQDEVSQIKMHNRRVWISSHADCSERCEPWQGKLYSTDGTSGEVEGHKYIPLEVATQSNIVTTSTGKVWNNSVIVGFNCRHYLIPFVPGTVPVIEYDRKIIAREREITSNMRKMERDIITGKTLHRLFVEAQRDNKLNLPKHHIDELKREVLERTRLMNEQYQKYCENNGRAYYPWRTQILLNKQDASKIVDEKIILIDNKYQSIYNDDGHAFKATKFSNKKLLEKHIKKHLSDFPGIKPENYEKYAKAFLSQKVDGEKILGFTNKNGFIFRYDKKNNIFATAKPDGTIETFYKPEEGIIYWEEEIDKHGKTKN